MENYKPKRIRFIIREPLLVRACCKIITRV